MATKEQLQRVLTTMPDIDEVTVVEDRTLIATVVSGAFRDQDEGERQATVWRYLRRHLGSEDDLANIEFIFTNTPEEMAA
jgi:hypothetical protein